MVGIEYIVVSALAIAGGMVHAQDDLQQIWKPKCIFEMDSYQHAFEGVCQNYGSAIASGLKFHSTSWGEVNATVAEAACRWESSDGYTTNFAGSIAAKLGGAQVGVPVPPEV
ncbi:uncharacterized protein L201_005188 [Kwoniella dendrophila CBS 6074]|uniref:Uncharacterized protein n=1 Tax=Kwoniella dendrophila CBS 6074 TaxID=1295534 RepID=A0AAX4K0C0_9TREE